MPQTTRGYPYPQNSDRVDVPGDMQAALEAVDGDVGGHVAAIDSATTDPHHTLGTGALQAAAGNHGHTVNVGDVVGIGKQIVATGQAGISVAQGADEGYIDVSYTGHQSYRLLAFAQGSRGVYCIGNQALSTTTFRLTVWYDTPAAQAETRYVNWLLVQM